MRTAKGSAHCLNRTTRLAQSKPAGQLERQEFSLFRPNTAEFCVKNHWNSSCVCKIVVIFFAFRYTLKCKNAGQGDNNGGSENSIYPGAGRGHSGRGGSLLVSAAAGSGKTRVLVERVAGLITDPDHPVDADSLLIMTFTNAAAAKLRADITKRLAAEIRQHPQDVRLRRQQMRLQRASIGTVDAFCLHFVQQNFSALDVPPDFTIADDATLVRLQQETLSTVLEQAYTDPDFCAFADLYDRGRTDDTTGRAVQELYHFTQALPHPAQALQRFVEMWQSDAPPEKTQWGQAVLRETSARIKGVLRLLRTAQKIAAKDPAADKALTAVLMDDEDRMLLVLDRLDHGAWDTVPEALDNADNWRRAGGCPVGSHPT